jgi:ribonuclease P protein component
MASVTVCGREPAVPSSGDVGPKAVAASPRRAAPYISLRRSSDIGRVRRTGTRRRRGGVTVYSLGGRSGAARAAFVAGKGTGTAVRRNRAKRRLREAMRKVPLPEGYDFVVTADRSVVEVPFETVVSWMREALEEE